MGNHGKAQGCASSGSSTTSNSKTKPELAPSDDALDMMTLQELQQYREQLRESILQEYRNLKTETMENIENLSTSVQQEFKPKTGAENIKKQTTENMGTTTAKVRKPKKPQQKQNKRKPMRKSKEEVIKDWNPDIGHKHDRQILHQWQGEKLTESHPDNIMRCALNNIGGFGTSEHKEKAHQAAESMEKYHINFMGMPESRPDMRSRELEDIQTILNDYDTAAMAFHTNTARIGNRRKKTQMGGVSSFIDGSLAKKYNGVEHDPLGRWTCVKILTNKAMMKLYTVYKVCKNPTKCNDSAWHDQERVLKDKRDLTKPEVKVAQDLGKAIEKDMQNNCYVLVMADANERLTDSYPRLDKTLKKAGMINILESKLGTHLPPTQQDGLEAIDHAWCSPNLFDHIKGVGIAPMRMMVDSDHRAVIIDIDITQICANPLIYLTPYERRRLKSVQPKKVEKYIAFVLKQWDKQGIAKRLALLRRLIETGKEEEAKQLLESLDKQICAIQLQGERRLPAMHGKKFSPKYISSLKVVQKRTNKYNYAKRVYATKPSKQNKKLMKEARERLNAAKSTLKENEQNAEQLRREYLMELAEAYVKEKKFKTLDISFKVLLHIEKQKAEARKIRASLKSSFVTSLSHILIPAKDQYPVHMRKFYKDPLVIWNKIEEDNAKNIKNWVAITERDELERILLDWQCLHFTQAQDTPLSSPVWEAILTGHDNINELLAQHEEDYDKLDKETQDFLKELYDEKPSQADTWKDMELEDFRQFIDKKKEKTSTSPSGRHLGHFKAILNEEIFKEIFFLIQSSLRLSYIPTRWRNTVTTLLEKDTGSPRIHRLRTIHIVEPEVQFISNYYWSKQFLQYCEKQQNHITDNQYGGRRGRWAKSAIVKTQLMWDIARMQNLPMVTHLADARANFDRNISHIVKLALEKRQFPKHVAEYYRQFLELQVFTVRTAYGVSDGSYSRNENNRIFGDCQGLSWSAINQIVISSVIDNVYQINAAKFSMSDHEGNHELTSGLNYFIDDRITNTILEEGKDITALLETAQKNEELQTKYLNAAGGALAPLKCGVWVLDRNSQSLNIKYKTEKALPGTLHLQSTEAYEPIPLRRYKPNKSQKYLGAKVNPEMCPLDQISALEEKIDDWASKTNHCFLKEEEVLKSLKGTLYPQVEWPMVGSDMSYQQCDKLMGRLRKLITARQKLHSKTKVEITHGPLELAGLDLLHFFNVQGQAKVDLLRKHFADSDENPDTLYKMLMISLSDHMMWLGRFSNFLNESHDDRGFLLSQRSWLGSVWKFLSATDLKLDLVNLPTYKLPRENDKYIMDIVLASGQTEKDLLRFNRVRMNMQLLSLSDIVLKDGKTLHSHFHKRGGLYRTSKFKWPRREKLNREWVKLFYRIIDDVIRPYLADEKNHLGDWISESHQVTEFSHLSETEIHDEKHVYIKLSTGTYTRDRVATADEANTKNWFDVEFFNDHKVREPSMKHTPVEEQTEQKVQEEAQIKYFAEVPKWQRRLWGMKKVTRKDILKLLDKCRQPFILATDGGSPNDVAYGTYAYVLADQFGNIFYENYGHVQLNKDQDASIRYEAQAMLAGVTLLNFVEKIAHKNGIRLSSRREYSCDNEEFTKLSRDDENDLAKYKAPHRDIIIQFLREWKVWNSHPGKLSWVKGHQDRVKHYSEWTVLEALNIRADKLCHVAHRETIKRGKPVSTIAEFYPAQQFSVRNKQRRFVKEKPSELHKDKTRQNLKTHMCVKNFMSQEAFEEVAWESIGSITRKASSKERIRITKIVHDKRMTMEELHRMDQHPTGMCFMCGKQMETQNHMFDCTCEIIKDRRDKILLDARIEMENKGTPHEVAAVITRAVANPQEASLYMGKLSRLSPSMRWAAEKAMQSQSRIGWAHLRKGFLSKHWKNVARLVAAQSNTTIKPEQWEAMMIRKLFQINSELWRSRCKLLHPREHSYRAFLQRKATDLLLHLKKRNNRYMVGIYTSVIRYRWDYFRFATKFAILDWLDGVRHAIKKTREYNRRTQPLIDDWLNGYTYDTNKKKRRQNQGYNPEFDTVDNHIREMISKKPLSLLYESDSSSGSSISDDSYDREFLWDC